MALTPTSCSEYDILSETAEIIVRSTQLRVFAEISPCVAGLIYKVEKWLTILLAGIVPYNLSSIISIKPYLPPSFVSTRLLIVDDCTSHILLVPAPQLQTAPCRNRLLNKCLCSLLSIWCKLPKHRLRQVSTVSSNSICISNTISSPSKQRYNGHTLKCIFALSLCQDIARNLNWIYATYLPLGLARVSLTRTALSAVPEMDTTSSY